MIQATLREEIAVGREVDMFWCGWARLYRVETLHGNFTLEFHNYCNVDKKCPERLREISKQCYAKPKINFGIFRQKS